MKRWYYRWAALVAAVALASGCSKAEEQTRVVDPETAACERFHAIVSAQVKAHPEGGGEPQLHLGSAGIDAGAAAALLEQQGERLRCHATVVRKTGGIELTYLVAAFSDARAAEAVQQQLASAPARRQWYRRDGLLFVISASGKEQARVEPRFVTAGKKAIGFQPGVHGARSSEPRLSQP